MSLSTKNPDNSSDARLKSVLEMPFLLLLISHESQSLFTLERGDWKSITDEPHYELRSNWASNLSESAMLAEFRQRKESGKALFAS
jgi:hypothetical protein